MKLRPLSRRRAFISSVGSRLVSLWRRWSAADWILDRLRERRTKPKNRPMFTKARLEVQPLEDRFYPNDPLNLLQTPLLGSLAILGGDLLKPPLRAFALPVSAVPPLSSGAVQWSKNSEASLPAMVDSAPRIESRDLPPGGDNSLPSPVIPDPPPINPGQNPGWQGADQVLANPLGNEWTAAAKELGGSGPLGGGLLGAIVNPFSAAPASFAAPGGGSSSGASSFSLPGASTGGGGSSSSLLSQLPTVKTSSTPTGAVTTSAQPLTSTVPGTSAVPNKATLAQNYAQLPMVFEPNLGQTDKQVNYIARGGGYTLFLTNSEAVLTLARPTTPATIASTPVRDVIRLGFAGANPNVQVTGQNDLLSRSNYFTGADSTQWIGDVPNYGQVSYKGLYNGIDALFYSNSQCQLEYDFVVAPGADPSQIQLSLTGVTTSALDQQGNLLLNTANGQVVQKVPSIYQLTNGVKQTVTGRYTITGLNQFGFQLDAYDATRPLYIDPVLSYSTYLGGSSDDFGYGIAVDNAGNTYITGSTASSSLMGGIPFPTANPFQGTLNGTQDAFVSKLNAAGNALMYSTYLGGSNVDLGAGITVDSAGNAYVVGTTSSTDFPTTPGVIQTTLSGSGSFIAKLNATGDALLYSTFLGGTGAGSGLAASGVAVDPQGEVFVTGTTGPGFVTTSGAFQTTFLPMSDSFILKLNPIATSRIYASYLGPTSGNGGISATGVALDAHGDAFLTGYVTVGGLPIAGGAYRPAFQAPGPDAFVTQFDPIGAHLLYSTYLSGGADQANAITLDHGGDAFITGWTTSSAFPTTPGAYQTTKSGGQDSFISELNSAGAALVFSTFLGGGGTDTGYAIALDSLGNAWVAGSTGSSGTPAPAFPTTSGTIQSTFGGGSLDAYVSEITPSGGLGFSTFLGGSSDDAARGIAIDVQNNIYVTGWTRSTNFPTAKPFQATNKGGSDAFVSKLGLTPPPPVFTGITPDTGISNADQLTMAQQLIFNGTATPNSTVTLSRSDLGVIGTATANGAGAWTFSYTSTVLPEGTYSFTATDTLNGNTSAATQPFIVVVDLTPPTVTLTVPATTTQLNPQVKVTAWDLNGLPNGTAVSIDVDLNHDGIFQVNEQGYATGTLQNGQATITLPPLSALGTYSMRARVSDRAGNQGTSTTVSTQIIIVTNPWNTGGQVLTSDPFDGMSQDQLGNLQVTHALDLDQSPGTAQGGGPSLVYNSDAVSVRPIVSIDIPTDNATTMPASLTVQLTWNNGTPQATQTFYTTGHSPGEVLRVAAQVNTAVTTTARYPWSAVVTVAGRSPVTISGIAYVVTQDANPFGAGWTLSTVDQLVNIPQDANGPAGQLRLYGTGEWRFYQDNGNNTFTSPLADNGTLVRNAGGTFTYTTPAGRTRNFDANGHQTSIVSADGNEIISFGWTGNQLTSMTAIDGASTTLGYTSGQLTSITTGSRSYTVTPTGTNLTRITNPDTGQHNFGYDISHHLTSDSFANLSDAWGYDSGSGTLHTVTPGDGGATTIVPVVVQGLSSPVTEPVFATETDPLSRVTAWQLDYLARPLVVVDAEGGVAKWARNANGWVTGKTDPLGRTTAFALDTSGYTTLTTLPDTNTIQYQYQSAFHALTQTVDERGDPTGYSYDTQGHLLTETNALNQTTSYSYYTNGLVNTVKDPLNRVQHTYYYDTARRVTDDYDALSHDFHTTYDTNGNVASETDQNNHTTAFQNDALGRVTQETEPITTIVWHHLYNGAGLETQTTDPKGFISQEQYNSRGLVTETLESVNTSTPRTKLFTYDPADQLTGERSPDGAWTGMAYDAMGRDQVDTDAFGNKSVNVYDLDGEQTATRDELGRWTQAAFNLRGWATQTTDALGNNTADLYDPAGNLTQVTDPLTHAWKTAFDALNRATQTTDPANDIVTTNFDTVGEVSSVTDADTHVTTYAYDILSRQTAETEGAGSSVARTLVTTYDNLDDLATQTDGINTTAYLYDFDNRLTQTTDALNHATTLTLDLDGNVTASKDALGKITGYAFDGLNRETLTTDPLGHTSGQLFDADGNTVLTLDGLNQPTAYGFDALDRKIATMDARGGITTERYDADSNETALTDPVGNTTGWQYDPDNRQAVTTDPLGNHTTVGYDAASRELLVTDRNGRSQTLGYDNADRVTSDVWRSSGGAIVDTLGYTRDPNGNVTLATDNAGGYSRTIDALDRVSSETDPFGLTLTEGYNNANDRTSVTDSLGGTVSSVFDAANRMTTESLITGGATQLTMTLGYSNRDELTSETRQDLVNGSMTTVGSTTLGHDDAGRLTSLQHKNGSGGNLANYGYNFDNANRLTTESLNGTAAGTYTYDRTNEILGDGSNTFGYDLNGNRNMTGYTTGADNRMSTDGTWTYSYDNEGNTTKKTKGASAETWYYTFDNANHMTSARQEATDTGPTGAYTMLATYVYDAFGNRIEKDVTQGGNTTVSRFVYDGSTIWADLDSGNHLTERRLSLGGPDGDFARVNASGTVGWFLPDHEGSIRDITDNTGAVVDHLDYSTYGAVTRETSPGSNSDRMGFQGGEKDAESGLDRFGARYVDPLTFHWTSEDPLGFGAGDTNLYRPMGNGPTNATDPSGLEGAPTGVDIIRGSDLAAQDKRDIETWWKSLTMAEQGALNARVSLITKPIVSNPGSPNPNVTSIEEQQRGIILGEYQRAVERGIIETRANPVAKAETERKTKDGIPINLPLKHPLPSMSAGGVVLASGMVSTRATSAVWAVGAFIVENPMTVLVAIPAAVTVTAVLMERDQILTAIDEWNLARSQREHDARREPKLIPGRDATGKIHTQDVDLPDHVPSNWTRDDIEEAIGEFEGSIAVRKEEMAQLGEEGQHRRRLQSEETFLRKLRRKLATMPGK